jgi:hypothetical protein
MATNGLSPEQTCFLREAAGYLEGRNYLMRVAGLVGQPLETLARKAVPERVLQISNDALRRAMDLAAESVPSGTANQEAGAEPGSSLWPGRAHTLATVLTGGVGGAFGLPGLALELPITTAIMFRSIASIARSFGEDLKDPAVRLECLTVFSHTGPSAKDRVGTSSSYLATRAAMATMVHEAAIFLSRNAGQVTADVLAREGAPVLINLLAGITSRFNILVSEKFLIESIPILGAFTGAAINGAFSEHFSAVARYHFGIRRLERLEGAQRVQQAYLEETRRLREKRE